MKIKFSKTVVLVFSALVLLVVTTVDFYLWKYSLEVELEIKQSTVPAIREVCELIGILLIFVFLPIAAFGFCIGLKNLSNSWKWGAIAISIVVIYILIQNFSTFTKSAAAAYEHLSWGEFFSFNALFTWILICAFFCICEKPVAYKIIGGLLILGWICFLGNGLYGSIEEYLFFVR